MNDAQRYIVAGAKPWNRKVFDEVISRYPGQWRFICESNELTDELIEEVSPRYIFFLHWSWIVPAKLTDNYECVCFHMTDVPYGRGGSPLQNLIVRGHRTTKLTALRMSQKLDAGPVYLKEELSLEGNAEEIYVRASELSAEMIQRIVSEQIEPQHQAGDPVIFKRRGPSDSRIPGLANVNAVYDFIRMLDAESYPRAFLEYGGFRFEFSRAASYSDRIVADVTITPASPTER